MLTELPQDYFESRKRLFRESWLTSCKDFYIKLKLSYYFYKISASLGSDCEEKCLMVCDVTFRRKLLPHLQANNDVSKQHAET